MNERHVVITDGVGGLGGAVVQARRSSVAGRGPLLTMRIVPERATFTPELPRQGIQWIAPS